MKKILFLVLCLFSILTLASCGNKTTTQKEEKKTVEVLESELENQMISIAEFLDNATFAVLNYSSTESENASSLGSGVIYKKIVNSDNTYTYYLVTNRHVIAGGEKFKVYSPEGTTTSANVLGTSEKHDIGVLTFISYTEYNVVSFANIDDVKQGEYCFAMGTPLYIQYINTFTKGNVSGIRKEYVQHTSDINSGNSGGPLVNLNGELIGINVSKLSNNSVSVDIDGMCLAIRCDIVEECIDEIEGMHDAVINPLLGMTVTDVEDIIKYNYDTFDLYWNALKEGIVAQIMAMGNTRAFAEKWFDDNYSSLKDDYLANYNYLHAYNAYIPSGTEKGMLIREVVTNSVSDKAGLKIGDVVTKINDKDITNQTDFSKEFYKQGKGDTFTITVNRGGEIKTVSITL